MRRRTWGHRQTVLALITWMLGFGSPAFAASTAGSSAYGESVNLTLQPIAGVAVSIRSGPQPVASGNAPPAYNSSNSGAPVQISNALTGLLLTTGILNVSAASSVPNSDSVSAEALVNSLNANIAQLLALASLTADTVRSSVSIGGACGSLSVSGSTLIQNGRLSGSAASSAGAEGSINSSPAPNTVLLNTGGIRIVLNEQTAGGNGRESAQLTVNAVHIYLLNVSLAGIGTLSGDIIVAQSQAQLQCTLPGAASDLSLALSASPNPVTAGGDVTLALSVTNQGPNAAGNVVATHSFNGPSNLISATPSQGSCSQSAGAVTCSLGGLASGNTANITLVHRTTGPGTLSASAGVSASEPDPNAANNTASVQVRVDASPATASSDLALSLSVSPNPATVGGTLTYSILVRNQGPDAATNIQVSDRLAGTVQFLSAAAGLGACTHAAGVVSCTLPRLSNGSSATVTVTALASAPGAVINTANVSGAQSDPNPVNNSATLTSTVVAPAAGDLSISLDAAPPNTPVGSTVSLGFQVTNHGPTPVRNIRVTGSLPLDAGLVSVSFGEGSCTTDSCAIACTLPILAAGASATATVVLTPGSAGTVTPTFSVSAGETDPNPSNNSVAVTLPVNPMLALSTYVIGGGVSSSLVLTNPLANENASGTLELFDGSGQPLPATVNGVSSGGRLTFDIAPGAVAYFETEGAGSLVVGSAQIRSNIPIGGTILFRGSFGLLSLEAEIPSQRWSVPVELNTARGISTVVALSNPTGTAQEVRLTLNGNAAGASLRRAATFSLPGNAQAVKAPQELFPDLNLSQFRGTIEVSSPSLTGGAAVHVENGLLTPVHLTSP